MSSCGRTCEWKWYCGGRIGDFDLDLVLDRDGREGVDVGDGGFVFEFTKSGPFNPL
jgi:hypothetical protein